MNTHEEYHFDGMHHHEEHDMVDATLDNLRRTAQEGAHQQQYPPVAIPAFVQPTGTQFHVPNPNILSMVSDQDARRIDAILRKATVGLCIAMLPARDICTEKSWEAFMRAASVCLPSHITHDAFRAFEHMSDRYRIEKEKNARVNAALDLGASTAFMPSNNALVLAQPNDSEHMRASSPTSSTNNAVVGRRPKARTIRPAVSLESSLALARSVEMVPQFDGGESLSLDSLIPLLSSIDWGEGLGDLTEQAKNNKHENIERLLLNNSEHLTRLVEHADIFITIQHRKRQGRPPHLNLLATYLWLLRCLRIAEAPEYTALFNTVLTLKTLHEFYLFDKRVNPDKETPELLDSNMAKYCKLIHQCYKVYLPPKKAIQFHQPVLDLMRGATDFDSVVSWVCENQHEILAYDQQLLASKHPQQYQNMQNVEQQDYQQTTPPVTQSQSWLLENGECALPPSAMEYVATHHYVDPSQQYQSDDAHVHQTQSSEREEAATPQSNEDQHNMTDHIENSGTEQDNSVHIPSGSQNTSIDLSPSSSVETEDYRQTDESLIEEPEQVSLPPPTIESTPTLPKEPEPEPPTPSKTVDVSDLATSLPIVADNKEEVVMPSKPVTVTKKPVKAAVPTKKATAPKSAALASPAKASPAAKPKPNVIEKPTKAVAAKKASNAANLIDGFFNDLW